MPLLIARRPVFDSREQIFAYDLAVHGAPDEHGMHREVHPEQLLAEVFLETGIQSVADGHSVFVTVSHELLLGGMLRILPADRVIIQVPPAPDSDIELIAACHDLATNGYRLALTVEDPAQLPTPLGSAHVIRVDVATVPAAALRELAHRLRGHRARLLATNVQHRGQRDWCEALGFDLFEGYRFSAPETLSRREIGVEHLQIFRVLKQIRDPRCDDREIEQVIQKDVGLSYKLLRMVNSAAVGGRQIQSIGHALRLLGREQMARWLSVLLVSDGGDTGVRGELTHQALVRARMSETVAELAGSPRASGSAFLVGMLSLLDQLLEVPIAHLCESMDLAPDLRNALLQRAEFLGSVLTLVESYVLGRWTEVESLAKALDVPTAELQSLYLDALGWATSQRRAGSRG